MALLGGDFSILSLKIAPLLPILEVIAFICVGNAATFEKVAHPHI